MENLPRKNIAPEILLWKTFHPTSLSLWKEKERVLPLQAVIPYKKGITWSV